jgi:hypothetical protein
MKIVASLQHKSLISNSAICNYKSNSKIARGGFMQRFILAGFTALFLSSFILSVTEKTALAGGFCRSVHKEARICQR